MYTSPINKLMNLFFLKSLPLRFATDPAHITFTTSAFNGLPNECGQHHDDKNDQNEIMHGLSYLLENSATSLNVTEHPLHS